MKMDTQHSTHGAHDHDRMTATAHSQHTGHDKHAGHSPAMFKRRFFVCLLLTLPVLYLSPMFEHWFNYRAIQFPGSNWITPILATIIYFYGGLVFLKGAWNEFHGKIGMMTLVALAISVSFGYSIAVTLGLKGDSFYMELATLVDVMLLGHWMDMPSIISPSIGTCSPGRMIIRSPSTNVLTATSSTRPFTCLCAIEGTKSAKCSSARLAPCTEAISSQ